MKSTDFLKENSMIVDGAMQMEQDHEVEMARSDLYNTARYAIELHKLLKSVSETQGLEGWVQSKITKAADYLAAVHEHLLHQEVEKTEEPDMFAAESLERKFNQLTNETTSAAVATVPAAGGNNAGTLFGGNYKQKKSPKKESVIKRTT